MRPLYKTQFTLDPLGSRSPEDVADEVTSAVSAWIDGHYKRAGHLSIEPVQVREITRSLTEPYQIKSEQLTSGEFHRAIYWAHPTDNGDYYWTSLCDLAYAGQQLDFWFSLGVQAKENSTMPQSILPARPRLISNLLANPHWRCLSDGHSLPLTHQVVTATEVEAICEDMVFSASRAIPLIIMSPVTSRSLRYPVEPRTLAERIAGTAKVLVARDSLTVDVFNQFLGSDLSVPMNALRVFAPRLDPGDSAEKHWCFLGETMKSKQIHTRQFADFLFARLAERSVSASPESGALLAYRRISAEMHYQRLEEVQQELTGERSAASSLLDEASEQIVNLQAEIASLNEQLRERDDRIRALDFQLETSHRSIADLSRELGRPAVEHASVSGGEATPRSVAELTEWACEALEGLVVLEGAIDSARKVPETFKFPDRVKAAFIALNDAAGERARNGSLGTGLKEYFQSKGFEYKPRISETARTRWGDEYKFLYDGRRVLFEEHFTVGTGSANTCLSIHFSTRLRPDKVVIAYAGRHLRNTLS